MAFVFSASATLFPCHPHAELGEIGCLMLFRTSHSVRRAYVAVRLNRVRIIFGASLKLTFAFFQLNWRALTAFVMLVAFVMPVTAEAACYELPVPSRTSVQTVAKADVASATTTEAPAPAKTPAGKPSHAALCQHAHCGHAQAWPELPAEVGALRLARLSPVISPHGPPVASWLIDGPERPPQA